MLSGQSEGNLSFPIHIKVLNYFLFDSYICYSMKICIWFLSLCLLILSFTNCEDAMETPAFEKNQVSFRIQKDQNHADQDSCSPLCTCNCCGQPLLSPLKPLGLDFIKTEESTQNQAAYKCSFTAGFLNNIWQPPKLRMNTFA